MATERVVIQFRADGTRVVTASIKGVGGAAKKASKETDTLKNALKALIAIETARRIVQLADAFTLLQNRVRVLTDDQAGLVRTTQSLFETANRTRGSIESTALLFQRLTLATKGLVSGEREVLEIVETLNKALKISGATTQEAAAGSIQLAQGFAFGALRGDELRSVMEQLPVISRILEKELGVTRGELRALGQEGAITSEIMVRAFQNSQKEIEEAFGKVIPTIADQFVVLRNNVIKLVGDFEQATGLFRTLAEAIGFAAQNLETFAKIAAVLAIPAIIALTAALKALIAAGGLIGTVFLTAAGALKAFFVALTSITGSLLAGLAAVIIFRKEIGEFFGSFRAGNRELKIFEAEAVANNNRLRELADKAKAAAKAAALFTDKLLVQKEALKQETKFLELSVSAQDEFILNEKLLGELRGKGIDLSIKGREAQRKEFIELRKIIQLQREESDLLRKLEGPLVKINRERATARRLIAQQRGDKELLLKVEKQRFAQNDKLIEQLKQETVALKQSTVAGQLDADIQAARNALEAKGIDLNSAAGRVAANNAKIEIEANRAAAVRRQNLRDFNIDLSERAEREIDLANILKESVNNEFRRTQIIKELTIEEAKRLVQLKALSSLEFDKVVDKTLQPLREQLTILKAEDDALNLSNVERAITIDRLTTEIALRRQDVDVTDDFVKSLLDEIDAQRQLNAIKARRKSLEQEFGIDQSANQERAAELNELLQGGNRTFDQRIAIMRELNEVTAESTDFTAGLKQAFLDIDTTVLKFGQDVGGFLVGAINGAADALAEFAVDGFQDTKKLQQALSDLFRSLAKDIVAATIKLIIFKTIQAAFDLGGGGFGSATTQVVSGAAGGAASGAVQGVTTPARAQAGAFLQAGQPAIVGERGPEPFVPTQSGRVLPNAALEKSEPPQVTIVNVTDPKEVQAFLSTAAGEDVIMNVIQKRQRQVRGLVK